MMAVICFALVVLGIGMIVVGCLLSIADWRQKRGQEVVTEATGLSEALTALAKLAEALRGYPTGMRLIVFGIVVLIIAGLFGGVAALRC